jgi:OmpA-OmpF porin, OOP family
MKLKLLAGAALAAAFMATAVSAQDIGWYGAVDLGWHTMAGIKTESDQNAADAQHYKWTYSTDDDWTGFVRLGYQFTPNVRVELEGGYRPGDVDSIRGSGLRPQPIGLCAAGVIRTAASPACKSPEGTIDSATLMVNALYDFMPDSVINPFVGVGVGLNELDLNITGQFSGVPGAITAANPAIQVLTINEKDMAISGQAIAGLAWKATDKLKVDATYRYLFGADHSWQTVASNSIQPGAFSGQYKDQSLTLGLRYSFAAPPPAFEAREFIVYFPFDQYVLTPEAQTVVQQAAKYAMDGKATRVTVVGHADTSGSAAYNVRLSERRGKAVADALVGLGLASSTLTVDWKGESMPAVATGDGVKEPLNRRSTIGINF